MKILGIVGSPSKEGNTEILVAESPAAAQEAGAEVEMLTIADKNIAPCDGCESCRVTRKCKINDDMQEIYAKLSAADGIIFGTPVYFWTVTAQMKALMDRTYSYLPGRRLRNKVAGMIVVARRTGTSTTFSTLYNFINLHRMIPASNALALAGEEEMEPEGRGGGAIVYGSKKGDARQDKMGMDEARALGRTVVKAIKGNQNNRGS